MEILNDHTSITKKTDYKKVKPDLRRHYPEHWGRFLDNHYDPEIHKSRFTVAMKAPDSKYKYSPGVGLSYKFVSNKVLERLEVENQEKERLRFVRFEEFSYLKRGDVMVSIEHCVNCHKHNTSTKHDENKYRMFATNLQGAIKEQFPLVQVIIKPISTEMDQKLRRFKTDANREKPTIIDSQMNCPRLGAFEVQIYKFEGKPIEKILHSKLQSGFWPSFSQILEKIHFYLNRIPKLSIQLYKDNNGTIDDEGDQQQFDFSGMQITLSSTYTSTASQMQINNYLEAQESQRKSMMLQRKSQLNLDQQSKMSRPQTASTQVFSPSKHIPQNQRNLRSMQSQPFMRPSSASTFFQNMQKSTDNTSALTTLNNMPSRQQQHLAHDTYGLMQNVVRPASAVSAKTDFPRAPRPFSASTKKSNQSMRKIIPYIDKVEGVVKKGRGLGFFGDDDDRVKNFKDQKDSEAKIKVQSQQLESGKTGRVTIPNVPIGLYTIEVQGNGQFQPARREVNLVNDEEKDELVIYVGMKLKMSTVVEMQIISTDIQNNQQRRAVESVRAVLIPGVSERELEEYEFDVIFNDDTQLWEADLSNGNYLVIIKGSGGREYSELIQVRNDQRAFQINYTSQKNVPLQQLQVKCINIQSGKPVDNVFLQVFKNNCQQPDEAVTDDQGTVLFNFRDPCTLILTSQKTGYANLARKFDITKALIQGSQNKPIAIVIPMVKDLQQDQTTAFGVLSYVGPIKNLKLTAFSLAQETIETKRFETLQVVSFDTTAMSRNSIFDESMSKSARAQDFKNPAVRFAVQVGAPEMLQVNIARLDQLFKNQLQEANLQFSIIYRDQTNSGSAGQYVMRTFEAPSFTQPEQPLWDICFFTYPYIIETNVMLAAIDKPEQFFSYYTKLSVFLKNRKGMAFSEALGFDQEGVFRMDDTWVDPGVFKNGINDLIGTDSQKLWSHDQKKVLQRYFLKKETEDKVLAIHQDIGKFYEHFTQSMMNMFAKVSYKRFNDFILRL